MTEQKQQQPAKVVPNQVTKVDVTLECNHMNILTIDGVIFLPRVGDVITCKECGAKSPILIVGYPFWDNE